MKMNAMITTGDCIEHAAHQGGQAWVYTTGELMELMGTDIGL